MLYFDVESGAKEALRVYIPKLYVGVAKLERRALSKVGVEFVKLATADQQREIVRNILLNDKEKGTAESHIKNLFKRFEQLKHDIV